MGGRVRWEYVWVRTAAYLGGALVRSRVRNRVPKPGAWPSDGRVRECGVGGGKGVQHPERQARRTQAGKRQVGRRARRERPPEPLEGGGGRGGVAWLEKVASGARLFFFFFLALSLSFFPCRSRPFQPTRRRRNQNRVIAVHCRERMAAGRVGRYGSLVWFRARSIQWPERQRKRVCRIPGHRV